MSRARNQRLIAAFGQVVAELRGERGLSQEAMAHEAGIDRSFAGMIERGERQPSLSIIFVLAAALSIKPEKLIAETRARAAE
jgi:transcriptional regulator with XRE-family HTH domain